MWFRACDPAPLPIHLPTLHPPFAALRVPQTTHPHVRHPSHVVRAYGYGVFLQCPRNRISINRSCTHPQVRHPAHVVRATE